MPTPAQVRSERIDTLVNFFKGHNNLTIDEIVKQAQTLYPYTRPKTVFEYAEVAFNIIRNRSEK